MSKTFKIAGVSKGEGGYKVRFAAEMTRVKVLAKYFTDVQLIELPHAMEKPAIITYLKTTELYQNPQYAECIDAADAKYNPVVKAKKEKTPPSLDAIKARVSKAAA